MEKPFFDRRFLGDLDVFPKHLPTNPVSIWQTVVGRVERKTGIEVLSSGNIAHLHRQMPDCMTRQPQKDTTLACTALDTLLLAGIVMGSCEIDVQHWILYCGDPFALGIY